MSKNFSQAELRAKFDIFEAALSVESDRGCALFAAAYLDSSLADMIGAYLRPDKKMGEDLFVGQAPLASFSSRIKLAYYLRLINQKQRKKFDTIRSIRNHFAHHAEAVSFEDQMIRDRCNNLLSDSVEESDNARMRFSKVTAGLLGHIHAAHLSLQDKPEIKQHLSTLYEDLD